MANIEKRSFYKLEWQLDDALFISEGSVEIFMF